jgi:hypothetical protein
MSDRDDFVERAKNADPLPVAQRLGAQLKKAGAAEWAGPCPSCGGTDRFSVNIKERVFNCRGFGGGDVIAMAAHIKGFDPKADFIRVCEYVLDEDAPGQSEPRQEPDPAIERERRDERKDAAIVEERKEAASLLRAIENATALFERGELFGQQFDVRPLEGTLGEDYFDARGIPRRIILAASDLRFIPNLPYRGFSDRDAEEEVDLGAYHCVIAALRDRRGRIQGVHRIYLDAGRGCDAYRPSGEPIKLRPPGDRKRNSAKKAVFHAGGGLILLGPLPFHETMACAEGIENAMSWKAKADDGLLGDEFAGASLAAAYSLGNLCGGATGTHLHPNPPRGRPNATIMNGEPDMGSAAIWLPPEVRRLVLIGDADADAAKMAATLRTGAERHRRGGVDVVVSVPKAPHAWGDGRSIDWNDLLLERDKAAA